MYEESLELLVSWDSVGFGVKRDVLFAFFFGEFCDLVAHGS